MAFIGSSPQDTKPTVVLILISVSGGTWGGHEIDAREEVRSLAGWRDRATAPPTHIIRSKATDISPREL
jgi:hypothetical protein